MKAFLWFQTALFSLSLICTLAKMCGKDATPSDRTTAAISIVLTLSMLIWAILLLAS